MEQKELQHPINQDDVIKLAHIFNFAQSSLIDISNKKELERIIKQWPLLTELNIVDNN